MLPWNLAAINVQKAWDLVGQGSPNVVIAVLDTGIDESHPALQGAPILPRILPDGREANWNFTRLGGPDPHDGFVGHGTAMAGLLIGNGWQDITGICPACRLLPLKIPFAVFPQVDNQDIYSSQAEAIQKTCDLVPPDTRMVILNLSWSTVNGQNSPDIHDAITAVANRNVLVITSAGNDWSRFIQANVPNYPSDYDDVISVAAVDQNHFRCTYSYFGDKVAISAPGGDTGNLILHAAIDRGGFRFDAGTSYAAAHVTGVAALVASALIASNQPVTVQNIRDILIDKATSFNPPQPGMGRGLVNAEAAVKRALGL